MSEDPSPLVTRDMLRADLHRALWRFSAGIVAANAVILAAAVTIANALD